MSSCDKEQNPYPGPAFFKEEQAKFFSGRKEEVSYLGSRILGNSVFLLYGESGAGKTSFVRAGLIPWLKNNGHAGWLQREGKEQKEIPIIRLEEEISTDVDLDLTENVFVALAINNLKSGSEGVEKICSSGESCLTFNDHLANVFQNQTEKGIHVLFFDQFEEFFYLHNERWDDRQVFFEQIADAIKKHPDLRIVFVLREDYLARMDDYARFLPGKLEARYHLTRLDADAAIDAILEPSKESPPEFEEEAAKLLLKQIRTEKIVSIKGGKTIEIEIQGEFVDTTIMQLACHYYWNKACEGELKKIDKAWLELFINDPSSPFQINGCLAHYYRQELVKAARAAEKQTPAAIAEWIKLKLTNGNKRKSNSWDALESGIQQTVLNSLKQSHLINTISGAGSGQEVVELMHDRWVGVAQEVCNILSVPEGGRNFSSEVSIKEFIDEMTVKAIWFEKKKIIEEQKKIPDNSFPSKELKDYCHEAGEDHFCLEVLEGKASFFTLPTESYDYLCNRPLKNVKKLRAYYITEARNKDEREKDKEGFDSYYHACKVLRNRAMAESTKLPAADFRSVYDYIKKKELNVQPECKQFYGNIDSAINTGDKERHQELEEFIVEAMKSESINCFQAAIFMYFLSPTLMETYNLQYIF
jgi:hypothetical protein